MLLVLLTSQSLLLLLLLNEASFHFPFSENLLEEFVCFDDMFSSSSSSSSPLSSSLPLYGPKSLCYPFAIRVEAQTRR